MTDVVKNIPTENLYPKVLQHELPDVDLTQGRGVPRKHTIFKSVSIFLTEIVTYNLQVMLDESGTRFSVFYNSIYMLQIGVLLDRLSRRLDNPGLDTGTDNLHNTTISVLFYYLEMLDVADLRTAYNKISGTSYKEETIR